VRATGVEAGSGDSPSVDSLEHQSGQTDKPHTVKSASSGTNSARLVHTQDTSAAFASCADVAQKPAQHENELSLLVLKWNQLHETTRAAILVLAGV